MTQWRGARNPIAMESTNLLVTDKSPETAEQINSLLRNSGIKIHVIHAKTGAEVKRAIDNLSPALIIFPDPDPKETTVEAVTTAIIWSSR